MTGLDRHRLDRIRTLADLLDRAFRVPGTDIRFGLDPVIGLIPGLGDVLTGTVSGYLLLEAARAGASPSVLTRMLLNVALDMLLGALPVFGDIFDVGFRANSRNVDLLLGHLEDPGETRAASRWVIAAVGLGFLGVMAAAAFVIGAGLRALWSVLIA